MKRSYSCVKSGERKILKAKRAKKETKTTLQRMSVKSPFPRLKKCDLLYENALTGTGSAALINLDMACNDLYDFDRSSGNYFGNKQPLFYDNLLTAFGPYKEYYVGSWETTYWILNETNVAIDVWVKPPLGAAAELDTKAEADNMPGVVKEYLTKSGGARDYCKVTVKGSIADFTGSVIRDDDAIGNYAASPTKVIYGGLVIASADGTTACNVYVAIKHVFHAELQWIDALVS